MPTEREYVEKCNAMGVLGAAAAEGWRLSHHEFCLYYIWLAATTVAGHVQHAGVPLLAGNLPENLALLADDGTANDFRQAVPNWRFLASSGTRTAKYQKT